MRIIHVTNNAGGPDQGVTLGIEREATNLAVAQQARGSEVIMALDRPGTFAEICQEHEIPVVVRDGLGRPFNRPEAPTVNESSVRDFTEFLKNCEPDIIHCHSWRAALVAITAGNRMGIPCVLTGDSPNNTIQAKKRGLRFATVCLTEASLDGLRRAVPGIEGYYVPNGTRIVPSAPARQTRADGYPVNLVLAGNLVERKGGDIAVMAMFQLHRRLGENFPVLNIYGDGPRKNYLTEMTSVFGLNNNVRFHGFKLNILENCPSTDMLIMPSRDEACPLVVLEAMSRGMPIVATDVGDVSNMIPDERYGRVVPPDSIIPFAEAIEVLLQDIASGRFNPDLSIERHRSFYSFEKWAERIEAVYKQVL